MTSRVNVAIEEAIALPLDAVWEKLADFPELPRCVPGVDKVEVFGSGIGMVRRVHFEGHFTDERLDVMDAEQHRVAYTVVDISPWVIRRDYSAEMRLDSDGADACRLSWRSTFTVPSETDVEPARTDLIRAYRLSIGGLTAAIQASRVANAAG